MHDITAQARVDSMIAQYLEHSGLPGVITGSYFGKDGAQLPLVGISGTGSQHERNGRQSVWFNGTLLSPTYIDNACTSCRSHIEGIVMDDGKMHVLEQVDDFLAREGDCYEYFLQVGDMHGVPLVFEGGVLERCNRNKFQPREVGTCSLRLNPHWVLDTPPATGASRNHSLPYHNRHPKSGTYIPQFWDEFLHSIESRGYDHPYGARTEALKQERS